VTWAAIFWLLAGAIVACLGVAVATDLESRIIPNRVTLLVLGCSLGLRLLPGAGPPWPSLLIALALLGGLGLLATYDLIGWGDAKLIPALAFALPPDRVVPLLLAITVTGGLLSCLYLAARLVLRRALPALSPAGPGADRSWLLRRLLQQEGARILANEPMPYAVAVFGGAVYTLATK
jgi:prepilin peptidase CpaA